MKRGIRRLRETRLQSSSSELDNASGAADGARGELGSTVTDVSDDMYENDNDKEMSDP